MKKNLIAQSTLLILIAFFTINCNTSTQNSTTKNAEFGIVIHGGAGTILKENLSDSLEKAYHSKLQEALNAGHSILEKGGTSIDAVQAAIMIMENSPLFNAGKGAVFTNAGTNELDASFMDGSTLNAGAVGGVTIVKNPITAARAVMEKSDHVMLSGEGANQFAILQKLDTVDNSYFYTERRFKSLQKIKNSETGSSKLLSEHNDYKFGTVGAAALDKSGNLAAGTSTGGMTNKKYGRIGDSPIIGAGTYANNATCAISCTGHGEFFIRYAVAHDVSALMEYKNMTLEAAGNEVINNKLVKVEGSGGLISIDKNGNVSMPFNTAGMYRGYMLDNKEAKTFIFK
ncbi:MAG: isoaspartyl peptidase/L-asparaginase family protein [Saprospiraceae bacterium]